MDIDPPLADTLRTAFGPGATITQLDTLMGDASTRLYQRAHLANAPVATAIVMRLPPDALTRSDEAAKASTGKELPFSNVLHAARTRGLRVPVLYADRTAHGNFTVLLEDLGDDTLFKRLSRTPRHGWEPFYSRAVDLLVAWQRAFESPASGFVAHGRRFERELLRWELDHFREWGLEALRGPLSPALRGALDIEFDTLADAVAALPTTTVHRDWQSKNLMVLPDDSLAILDFQDALVGPRPYDLVALLCDSYTSLTDAEQHAGIVRYATGAGVVDAASFTHAFHTQTVQRKLKDAGRFVFIDRVRKNPTFLEYIPQSVRYVHRALRALPERARLYALLTDVAPEWFGPDAPH